MEETLCSIEIVSDSPEFKAKVQTATGRYKEYSNENFELLLALVYEDLQEEMEASNLQSDI